MLLISLYPVELLLATTLIRVGNVEKYTSSHLNNIVCGFVDTLDIFNQNHVADISTGLFVFITL